MTLPAPSETEVRTTPPSPTVKEVDKTLLAHTVKEASTTAEKLTDPYQKSTPIQSGLPLPAEKVVVQMTTPKMKNM